MSTKLQIINVYFILLGLRSEQAKAQGRHTRFSVFLSSFFYERLTDTEQEGFSYKNVKRWVKVNLLKDVENIFIPINRGNNTHWALCVVSMTDCTITYYDSCRYDGTSYLKIIRRWLRSYFFDMHSVLLDISNWQLLHAENPTQSNGCDCGVFVCMFADFLSDLLPVHSADQQLAYIFRMRIALATFHGRLPYEEIV